MEEGLFRWCKMSQSIERQILSTEKNLLISAEQKDTINKDKWKTGLGEDLQLISQTKELICFMYSKSFQINMKKEQNHIRKWVVDRKDE